MYIKVQCNYTTYSELHCTLIYHIHDKLAIGTCMGHYIRVCPHDHVGAQAIYICVFTCVCVCARVRMYVFCLQLFPVCILGYFLWSHYRDTVYTYNTGWPCRSLVYGGAWVKPAGTKPNTVYIKPREIAWNVVAKGTMYILW